MSMKVNKNGKEYPVGVIPKNYPASNIKMANGESVEEAVNTYNNVPITRFDTGITLGDNFYIRKKHGLYVFNFGQMMPATAYTPNTWTHALTLSNSEDFPDKVVHGVGVYGQTNILVRISTNGNIDINPSNTVPTYFSISGSMSWLK